MVSGRCCYDRCACAGFKAGGADPYVCAACGHHEMLHAPPPRAAPPATTWFYVRPKQGLCNRIRVLSSSLLVVDDLGKPAGRRRGALARAFRAAGVGGDGPAPLCLRSDHGDRMAAYRAACPEPPRVKIALDWETMEPACATLYERLFAPHPLIAPLPPFAPSPRLAQFGDERARVAAELNAEIDLEAAFAAARRDDEEHDVRDANADAVLGATMSARGVVLTSHLMDEVTVLCDRISIMTKGTMRCLGTPQHLVDAYGRHYELTLVHTLDADPAKLDEFVHASFAKRSALDSVMQNRRTYLIDRDAVDVASAFRSLEKRKKALGVDEYMFNQPSLEQVFLKFAASARDDFLEAEPVTAKPHGNFGEDAGDAEAPPALTRGTSFSHKRGR